MEIAWLVAWLVVLGIYASAIFAFWGGLSFLAKRHPKTSDFLWFAMATTVLYSSALDGRYILASICLAYVLIYGWDMQDSSAKIKVVTKKEDDKATKETPT
jgi:hypothetical protein